MLYIIMSGRPLVYPRSDALRGPTLSEVASRIERPSPRIRMAMRLYATGAAKTKKEAAEMAGISVPWFVAMSNHNLPTSKLRDDTDEMIQDESVQMSVVLQKLGREALGRVRELSRSQNEHVALKAATDILDRNAETSKVQKLDITSTQIDSKDAKALAEALVKAAEVRREYLTLVKDGHEPAADVGPGALSALPPAMPAGGIETTDAR